MLLGINNLKFWKASAIICGCFFCAVQLSRDAQVSQTYRGESYPLLSSFKLARFKADWNRGLIKGQALAY